MSLPFYHVCLLLCPASRLGLHWQQVLCCAPIGHAWVLQDPPPPARQPRCTPIPVVCLGAADFKLLVSTGTRWGMGYSLMRAVQVPLEKRLDRIDSRLDRIDCKMDQLNASIVLLLANDKKHK